MRTGNICLPRPRLDPSFPRAVSSVRLLAVTPAESGRSSSADCKLIPPAPQVQVILGWCRYHPSRSECTCLSSQRHHRLALRRHSAFSVMLPRELLLAAPPAHEWNGAPAAMDSAVSNARICRGAPEARGADGPGIGARGRRAAWRCRCWRGCLHRTHATGQRWITP